MTKLTTNSNNTNKFLPLLITGAIFIVSGSVLADHPPTRINPIQVQSQHHQATLAPVFQIPFSAQCAQGFTKAGQQVVPKDTGSWTDEFICTTQVITCPKQNQPNGEISTVQPLVVIQKTNLCQCYQCCSHASYGQCPCHGKRQHQYHMAS